MDRIREAIVWFESLERHNTIEDEENTALAALKTLEWIEKDNKGKPFICKSEMIMDKFTEFLKED